jgi:hypothetical protein
MLLKSVVALHSCCFCLLLLFQRSFEAAMVDSNLAAKIPVLLQAALKMVCKWRSMETDKATGVLLRCYHL